MPTPAINVDATIPGKYLRRTRSSDQVAWGPWVESTFQAAVRYKETRPASSSVPLIRGFRKCKSWNHYISRVEVLSSTAYQKLNASGAAVEWSGQLWNGSLDPCQLVSNNSVNRALVAALEKLRAEQFNLGLFAAEAKQTSRLLTKTFTAIAKASKRYRDGKPFYWRQAKKFEGHVRRGLWCKIPEDWLELQYGWKPLMADVAGAVTHLYNRSRFSIPYVEVKHSLVEDGYVSQEVNGPLPGGGTLRHRFKRGVVVYLVYGLENPILAELSSLGLLNPASLVWEKMPWSFVVDWALPIGQWLNAMAGDAGYSFVTGGYTRWYKSSPERLTPHVLPSVNTYEPSLRGRSVRVNRTCFSSSPFPGLYVKNPLSPTHLNNAMALLQSVYVGKDFKG